jgi:energy-coupling factor transport system permease protein
VGLPGYLGRPGPTAYHRLNPLTKLVVAAATALSAVIIGGVVWPLAIAILAVALPTLTARVGRRLAKVTLLLSLPIGISALLVHLFFHPAGQEVLFALGPLTATVEGLSSALEIVTRILVISGAVTLFYLTTPPAELVLDLEQRGVSPRVAFVVQATAGAVPAMAERTTAIVAAQRARGLDTEGGLLSRIRGIVPLAGPVVLGSIAEVEERSMALEARAFTKPGKRSLLYALPDSVAQRLVRWGLLLLVLALLLLRAGGWTP